MMVLFHSETLVGIELTSSQKVHEMWQVIHDIRPSLARKLAIENKENISELHFLEIKKASKNALVFDSINFNCYLTRLPKGRKGK